MDDAYAFDSSSRGDDDFVIRRQNGSVDPDVMYHRTPAAIAYSSTPWEKVDDGEGGAFYNRSYQSDSGSPETNTLPAITVEAQDALPGVEAATPQTFGEFINPNGLAPYNPNWQADVVRYTLNDAIAQTARRNERVLTPIDSAAAIVRQRTVNNLAGAMGGPFVGGPMQMARMAGLNEYQVQEAGILGMAAQDALGMRGAGSATRLSSGARGGANGVGASPISAERAYLNQKLGRTGDLNADINARGASSLRREVDRLVAEGHAVGRHGERVTETAIDNRALRKFDPITGARVDYVTGGNHNVGPIASKFTTNRALLQAEAYVRGSPEYASAQANAVRNLDDQFAVKGLRLEDALGPNYLSQVFGKTRTGPVNTGTLAPTDFTDGTLTSVFRRSPAGNWNLHTLYPNPKP
ncbi:hypothetical protein J2X92_005911 [Variovorax paradoxus]|nr:hypothetical protein [Variovorax paradoxus]